MNIENSPFHITKNKVSGTNKLLSKNVPSEKIINKPGATEGSSFWDWFRGLVNPLQNLPIVSGIYSSMNSDDSNSDRDLVQNSLGGFMYGGPIGAIAGFGNWIFNKLFDKTPTELALDFTGISKIWKDDDKSKENLKLANQDLENKLADSKIFKTNNSSEWWKKSQFASFESKNVRIKNTQDLKETTFGKSSASENSNKLTKLSNRYQLNQDLKPNVSNISIKKDVKNNELKNIVKKAAPDNTSIVKVNNNLAVDLKEKNKFREINFNYPVWKPETLDVSKIKSENKNLINQKYLDIKEESNGSKLNMKL